MSSGVIAMSSAPRKKCLNLVDQSWGVLLNLVFPPRCAFCDVELDTNESSPIVCQPCVGNLLCHKGRFCPRCGAFRRQPVQRGTRCIECRDKKLRFDAVRPLGVYRADLQRAVLRMKQASGQTLAAAVGLLMAERLSFTDPSDRPDLAACIPKFWLRRIMRGTNSAETLMSALAGRWRLPAFSGLLRCRRNTNKQSMLSLRERQHNVRGAFSVRAGYDLRDAHILVVDDIMTTGATANEAARVLRKAGARRITIAVVGRAVSAL